MNKLNYLITLIFISFLSPVALAEQNVTWFHCPHVDEIKKINTTSDLEATTTINGVTIKWRGWIQSTNYPNQFTHVYFEGMQAPWVITCAYKDAAGNYGMLAPQFAEYKSDGKTTGSWSGRICYHSDPRSCNFSVIHNDVKL